MTTKVYNEDVLVFPGELLDQVGRFQGAVRESNEQYLRLIMDQNLSYIDRNLAEADPGFKQLIPYVMLRYQNSVLTYARGKSGGEGRLHALRSLGFGGHVNPEDTSGTGMSRIYRGMMRELQEELSYVPVTTPQLRGFINDDSNEVGSVHFGVVYVSFVRSLDEIDMQQLEDCVEDPQWVEVRELKCCSDDYETWSQLVIESIL